MENSENLVFVEDLPIWERRIGRESDRAFEYFCMYRDTAANLRSHRKLSRLYVSGKKTSATQIHRWSVNYKWNQRIIEFDMFRREHELSEVRRQHEQELTEYTESMFITAKAFNNAVQKKLAYITRLPVEEMPCAELRQLALTFDISNRWLCQLVGFQQGTDQ